MSVPYATGLLGFLLTIIPSIIYSVLVKLHNALCFFLKQPFWEHCSYDGHPWLTKRAHANIVKKIVLESMCLKSNPTGNDHVAN